MHKTGLTMRFENKVALVTASSTGIGYEIAKRLVSEGAIVIVCSRSEEKVKKAVVQIENEQLKGSVSGEVCNINRKEDIVLMVEKIVDKHGRIDVLVSNHGTNPYVDDWFGITDELFDKIMTSNVRSHFTLARLVYPHMPKHAGSNMLFTSSVSAFRHAEDIETYGVAKLALLGLVRSLSCYLAKDNIRVNSMVVGVVETVFSEVMRLKPDFNKSLANLSTSNRLANATEIAGPAAFLCSNDASYVNGENMIINGGALAI